MANILDRFQVLVRGCRPLQPDGYELTLEVRRKPDGGAQGDREEAARDGGEERTERRVPA
jgi:hypothetical protein